MKKTVFTITGWIITAVLIGSLFAKVDMGALWAEIVRAQWRYLAAAALLNIAVIVLKALRWQWMMRPSQPTRYNNLLCATLIGMAGNNVMPARGGDWLKIYLLGKWEGASRAMLTSITGLDKLFEGISILILFVLLSFHSTFPAWVVRGTMIVSIVVAAALAICIVLLLHHKRIQVNGADPIGKISKLAAKLGSGMLILAKKRMIVATLLLSIVICLLQIETIRLCQIAFGLSLALWVPALVYVAINLAIIVPSAPSGVGPFEAAAVLAYAWIGVGAELGMGIALCYHAVQFIPVTAAGALIYLAKTGRGAIAETEEIATQ